MSAMDLLDAAVFRLGQASVFGGVLVLIVLALRVALGRWMSPGWIFVLWLVVMVRLALPVAPIAPFSIYRAGHAAPAAVAPIFTPPAARIAPPSRPTEATSRTPVSAPGGEDQGLSPTLAMFWLTGALGFAAVIATGQMKLRRMARGARQLCDASVVDLLEECKERLGVRSPMTVSECGGIASPLLLGTIRPILLLPPGLAARLTRTELRSIFMHELAHVRRADIAIGWGATLVLIAHWFNPLVWLAVSRMKADRELACDAVALAAMSQEERPAYGRTLISLLEHASKSRHIPGLAAIAEDNGDIKRRITMVARFRPARRHAAALSAAFVAALACVSLTDAQPPKGTSKPEPAGAAPAGLTGQDVLRKVAEVYAAAESYEDEGVVVTKFSGGTSHTRSLPFKTVFTRPSALRYEFKDGSNRMVVWSDEKGFHNWWSVQPGVKDFDTIELAMAGPSGVSGGSATAITTLLLPDMNWGLRVTELAKPKLAAKEKINGVTCLKIEGAAIDGTVVSVWIDEETHAVHRTFESKTIDPAKVPGSMPGPAFTAETTITFKPRLNGPIAPERFAPGIPK